MLLIHLPTSRAPDTLGTLAASEWDEATCTRRPRTLLEQTLGRKQTACGTELISGRGSHTCLSPPDQSCRAKPLKAYGVRAVGRCATRLRAARRCTGSCQGECAGGTSRAQVHTNKLVRELGEPMRIHVCLDERCCNRRRSTPGQRPRCSIASAAAGRQCVARARRILSPLSLRLCGGHRHARHLRHVGSQHWHRRRL